MILSKISTTIGLTWCDYYSTKRKWYDGLLIRKRYWIIHRLATKYNLYNLQIYLFLILGIYVSILLSSSNVVVTFKCLRIRPFEVWKILRYIDGFDHKNRWKYVFIKGNDLNRYGKKKILPYRRGYKTNSAAIVLLTQSTELSVE